MSVDANGEAVEGGRNAPRELGFEIGAERTYLTHLTHDNFHADLEAELPRGISPAFDGLTVRID